jgi:pheromone shutdown protein TraB
MTFWILTGTAVCLMGAVLIVASFYHVYTGVVSATLAVTHTLLTVGLQQMPAYVWILGILSIPVWGLVLTAAWQHK